MKLQNNIINQLPILFAVFLSLARCTTTASNSPILDLRAQADEYVFIFGGYFDGAAAEQELTFIVLPSDQVHCVLSDTNWEVGDLERYYSPPIHVTSDGFYWRLSNAIGTLPNDGKSDLNLSKSFIIERRVGGKVSWGAYDSQSAKIENIHDIISEYAGSCWSFG